MPDRLILEYEGHTYNDTARMRGLIARAQRIKESLPPVMADHTRLWRGNRPQEVRQNPSYTNSLAGIALPFLDTYEGDLSYIDVRTVLLDKYLCRTEAARNAEFILPQDIVSKARTVDHHLAYPEGKIPTGKKPRPARRNPSARSQPPKGWDCV